jgi:hypothetical protein
MHERTIYYFAVMYEIVDFASFIKLTQIIATSYLATKRAFSVRPESRFCDASCGEEELPLQRLRHRFEHVLLAPGARVHSQGPRDNECAVCSRRFT